MKAIRAGTMGDKEAAFTISNMRKSEKCTSLARLESAPERIKPSGPEVSCSRCLFFSSSICRRRSISCIRIARSTIFASVQAAAAQDKRATNTKGKTDLNRSLTHATIHMCRSGSSMASPEVGTSRGTASAQAAAQMAPEKVEAKLTDQQHVSTNSNTSSSKSRFPHSVHALDLVMLVSPFLPQFHTSRALALQLAPWFGAPPSWFTTLKVDVFAQTNVVVAAAGASTAAAAGATPATTTPANSAASRKKKASNTSTRSPSVVDAGTSATDAGVTAPKSQPPSASADRAAEQATTQAPTCNSTGSSSSSSARFQMHAEGGFSRVSQVRDDCD